MQNFVNAILDGEPLIAPGEEGIHSVELANVMLYSSLLGQTVELPMDSAAYEKKLNQLIAGSKIEKKVVAVSNEDFTNRSSGDQLTMIFMGIGDEAPTALTARFGPRGNWAGKHLEPRGVEVPGFAKANFHDLPDAAFDLARAEAGGGGHRRLLLRLDDHELVEEGGRPVRPHAGGGQTRDSADAAAGRQVRPHHELQAGR